MHIVQSSQDLADIAAVLSEELSAQFLNEGLLRPHKLFENLVEELHTRPALHQQRLQAGCVRRDDQAASPSRENPEHQPAHCRESVSLVKQNDLAVPIRENQPPEQSLGE